MVIKLLELHIFFLISHIGFHYGNVSKVQNISIFSESYKYKQIDILMRYFSTFMTPRNVEILQDRAR